MAHNPIYNKKNMFLELLAHQLNVLIKQLRGAILLEWK